MQQDEYFCLPMFFETFLRSGRKLLLLTLAFTPVRRSRKASLPYAALGGLASASADVRASNGRRTTAHPCRTSQTFTFVAVRVRPLQARGS